MLRTRISITGSGVVGSSVMTHYWAATSDATGVTAVRSALSTWLTALSGGVSNTCTFTLDTAVDVLDASGVLTGLLTASSLSVVGGVATAALPQSQQYLIRWRTGSYVTSAVPGGTPRTHEVRGRTFVPGPTSGNMTGGAVSSSTQSSFTTASQALADNTSAGLIIWSPTHAVGFGVSVGECWSKFAVLRSRRD